MSAAPKSAARRALDHLMALGLPIVGAPRGTALEWSGRSFLLGTPAAPVLVQERENGLFRVGRGLAPVALVAEGLDPVDAVELGHQLLRREDTP